MRLPSINNENPLTWKCKLFGCRNEKLPLIYHKPGEIHGIIGWGNATATATLKEYTYDGCIWCNNYREIFECEEPCWPKWFCDCDICKNATATSTRKNIWKLNEK
jgi:hypothetical protein